MPATYYPAIVDRNLSGTGFGISFPDFPGCIANGPNVNEAAVNGELALAFHVDAMLKDGDALPEPSDVAEVFRDFGDEDVAGLMVRVDAPAKVARVLVSIEERLLRAIDAVAPNRSAFLAEAARAALERRPVKPSQPADREPGERVAIPVKGEPRRSRAKKSVAA